MRSLSDYNAGELRDVWLTATDEPSTMQKEIDEMLAASPDPFAEEWAIHDQEGFGGWSLSEFEDLETVHRVANGIAEHGRAFAEWIEYMGSTDEETIDLFTEAYQGNWPSMSNYVEALVEDVNPKITVEPESWSRYVKVDEEQLRRDLEIELYAVESPDGSINIFDPNIA